MSNENIGKIIIIEDNESLAKLFESWLQDTYAVEVAHDCATADDLLDETVDVVLLDRQLPDGTGDELLSAIRDDGHHYRVAMVTGVEPTIDIVEMGFDDYLCKPVQRQELLDAVEGLLAQADHGETIREYYQLVKKGAVLESEYSAAELEVSEKYAALEARLDDLQAELNVVTKSLDEERYEAELSRLASAGN